MSAESGRVGAIGLQEKINIGLFFFFYSGVYIWEITVQFLPNCSHSRVCWTVAWKGSCWSIKVVGDFLTIRSRLLHFVTFRCFRTASHAGTVLFVDMLICLFVDRKDKCYWHGKCVHPTHILPVKRYVGSQTRIVKLLNVCSCLLSLGIHNNIQHILSEWRSPEDRKPYESPSDIKGSHRACWKKHNSQYQLQQQNHNNQPLHSQPTYSSLTMKFLLIISAFAATAVMAAPTKVRAA